jgi:hypothetical protein
MRIRKHVLGTSRVYRMSIRNDAGTTVKTYTEANDLSAAIWRGDDTAIIAEPELTWRDPAQGTVLLRIDRDDIEGLEPGLYPVRLNVTDEDDDPKCWAEFYLDLKAAPGTAVPRKVYGTFDQMAVWYPRVVGLLAETDQTGAAEQRARARDWIDRWIEDHPDGRTRADVRALLADDQLVVTSLVSEIAAKKALAIVLNGQVTSDPPAVAGGRQSAHEPGAKEFEAEANALIRTLVAELDDGTEIDCRDPAFVMSQAPNTLRCGTIRLGTRCYGGEY